MSSLTRGELLLRARVKALEEADAKRKAELALLRADVKELRRLLARVEQQTKYSAGRVQR